MKTALLDHGYVKLCSYTQPVPLAVEPAYGFDGPAIGENVQRGLGWTGDLEIVRAARVSHNSDWRVGKDEGSDERLIRRLWQRRHTSPFEAVSLTFEVQAPIFVFRQWHRHRTQSYSEVSARYSVLPELYYVPTDDQIKAQSLAEKQGRDGELPPSVRMNFISRLIAHSAESFRWYKEFLDLGVSRELSRLFLGVNTYSRMYASANLLNWFRFLTLRMDPHAQYEIRVFADAMLPMISSVCPIAVDAYCQALYEDDPKTWENLPDLPFVGLDPP